MSARQEDSHEIAVLEVTTDMSGMGEQWANHGSDEASTAEVDIGDDNYQRLIEEDQSVDNVSCILVYHTCELVSLVAVFLPRPLPVQSQAAPHRREVAWLERPSTLSTPLWEQE